MAAVRSPERPFGLLPHQIRGFLATFGAVQPKVRVWAHETHQMNMFAVTHQHECVAPSTRATPFLFVQAARMACARRTKNEASVSCNR